MSNMKIKHNDKLADLQWRDTEELRTWASWQAGKAFYPDTMTDEDFMSKFGQRSQWNWNRITSLVDMLSAKKVVDVGSGVAVTDLIASSLNPDAEFYLVDKSENTRQMNGKYYQEFHGHYNSWDVVKDCITLSGLNKDKFHFLDPVDEWPDDIDLVLSTYSWCWHYPKETYWDKVMRKLRVGGTLALDVLYLPDRDTVSEITEAMKSEPRFIAANYSIHMNHVKDQLIYKNNAPGGFYVWNRK